MRATERQRKAADNLAKGLPIRTALLNAGYSESAANAGMRAVPGRVLKLLAKDGHKLIEVGKSLNLQDQANLVIGRLAVNTARGKDAGAMSAKILGSRRELNMFTPENQVGVFVVNPPQSPNLGKLIESDE